MNLIEREIHVSYQLRVHFTRQLFNTANPLLREVLAGASQRPSRSMVVVDSGLASLAAAICPEIERYFARFPELTLVREPMILPGGEQVKSSLAAVWQILAAVEQFHMDRHSYLLVVGGGALLDAAGFAAATAHRGLRLVRIPTTTLSQADSGVGVKNGVNAFGKKNFIGTFAPPHAVINDYNFLDVLPGREKRAGLIEAVKVSLIRDSEFFDAIVKDVDRLRKFEPAALESLILRCAELHIDHIARSGDPFEFGSARPLDFGHWAAHKLEQISGFAIRHGEAVAIGIAIDVLYSSLAGLLDPGSAERVLSLIEALGFDLFSSHLLRLNPNGDLLILEGLKEFQEHLGGELTVTLLKRIGQGIEVHEIDERQVVKAIGLLRQRAGSPSRNPGNSQQ
jgi:3-dehydroquinate synthase